jgi:hypothetical protein
MGSTQRNLQAHLNTLKKSWEPQTNESERTLPHGQYTKSDKEPKIVWVLLDGICHGGLKTNSTQVNFKKIQLEKNGFLGRKEKKLYNICRLKIC